MSKQIYKMEVAEGTAKNGNKYLESTQGFAEIGDEVVLYEFPKDTVWGRGSSLEKRRELIALGQCTIRVIGIINSLGEPFKIEDSMRQRAYYKEIK